MDYRLEQLRFQLREDPSSRIFFKLGEHLRREGELQEAIAVLGNGLEQHPKYVAAWVSLGRALLDAGSSRQATDALNRALALDPENAVASRHAGEAAIANGEWVEAIKALKRARAMSAPDEALDERIQFVESHLAELGQLEAPASRPPVEPVPPPPAGRSLDQVFGEAEDEPFAESAGDDVFVSDGQAETGADDEEPADFDGRATMAVDLSELSIPSRPVDDPAAGTIEVEPTPSPEPFIEIDADAIIEASTDFDDDAEIGISFDVDDEAAAPQTSPPASESEPVFDAGNAPDAAAAPSFEDVPVFDVESDTVPLSVPEIESPAMDEPDFDIEVEDDTDIDLHSEELPLPTMTLARLALDQADLELAEKTLRGVLERDPNHAEANELLAGLTAAAGGDAPGDRAGDETGDARAQALRRWLEAVRLASERLKS